MSFPYQFEAGFETGALAEFTAGEVDGSSRLNARHYTYSGKLPFPVSVPYEGAYCAEIDFGFGALNDAYVLETTGFAVSASTVAAMRFYLWVSGDLVMAASDTLQLFHWQSGAFVTELVIELRNNAGQIQVRGGDNGTATYRTSDLTLNTWHCLELVINTGSGVDGTCSFYVDGQQIGAQVTAITMAALTRGIVGAVNVPAGTTRGRLLIDAVVVDDTRVGPLQNRFARTRRVTKSGHLALGPGRLTDIALIGLNADNTVTVWDTDRGDTTDSSRIVYGPIQSGAIQDTYRYFEYPYYFTRGLYAQLTGTTPRASLTVEEAIDMSFGDIKELGNRAM